MNTQHTKLPPSDVDIICWIFVVLFFVIGVLNMFLVHPVPGILYLLLSFIYSPMALDALKKRLGFVLPFWIKLILGFIIICGTLAVGDLAEIFGL